MKRIKPVEMTTEALVERFVEIALAQDEALFYAHYSKYNRLYDKMMAVDGELRRRGTEARQALGRLYSHPDVHVRLQAATWSLAVLPDEARRVLQKIYDSKFYPQAGDAGMTLSALDKGTFKPD